MLVKRETYPTFGNLLNEFLSDFGTSSQFSNQLVIPSTNIKEFDEHIEIEMAVPGFTKEDFDIQLNEKRLTIQSKATQSKEKAEKDYFLQEFELRQFSRSFTLSDNIDTDNINAKYESGLLKIELAKKTSTETNQLRQIAIS